jgi:outer membrane immunogenic protein
MLFSAGILILSGRPGLAESKGASDMTNTATMKKILIAGVTAAAFLSAPALAGPPPSVFNWSGFYVGVNGGELSSKHTGVFLNAPGGGFNPGSVDVGTAGIHGGWQGQWGGLVAGIDGGFNAALSDKFASTDPTAPGNPAICNYGVHTCDARLASLFTVGGRLGWALNNILLYGSGGFASGTVAIQGGPTPGFTIQDVASARHSGSYYGAGIEYGLMNNLTIGIDWKHFDLGNKIYSPGNVMDLSTKGDAVTARLTIKVGS